MLLGVDVGGTFTDSVLVRDGRLFSAKVPTTPGDQSEGVIAAVDAVLGLAGEGPGTVTRFAHGMTVATNALLEGRVARTALVATEGFTDVVELGRQARPELYRLCAAAPAPLAPAELRFGAPERTGPAGPLRALEEDGARELVEQLAAADPEAIAVVLLHSHVEPAHERRLAEIIAERLPEVHVSLSHELVGTFREYERAATTEVDAALSPLLARYLRRLGERVTERGLPALQVMQSSGGLAGAERAAAHAALTVLSGPAGGARAAALLCELAQEPDVLCFDMGGTSCDVCVLEGGVVRETAERSVGGRPLALAMLDIHTVGAGGGSVAWRDAGGALRVGPRSAGADPGPAAYGRGGHEPTVTDANVLLGYLPERGGLAGGVELDRDAAADAVGALAAELGLDPLECARGIVRVANAGMVGALRVMTVERGVDPRGFALMPFGGAGPLHAAALADELGLERIVCPRASGVLSALGLAAAAPRRDATRSVLRRGEELSGPVLAGDLDELRAAALSQLAEPRDAQRARYHLRYRGQAFELPVDLEGDEPPAPEELRARFEAAHEERYGFRDEHGEIELVTITVSAWGASPAIEPRAEAGAAPARGRQRAWFGERELDAELLRGELPAGTRVSGPAICALPESTLVVPPGWSGEVDAHGSILLARGERARA